ncbi:putative RNA recognition motif domain, nucleotide-binding alpha-beta plait domain superfamily [Helianthus anomalus]
MYQMNFDSGTVPYRYQTKFIIGKIENIGGFYDKGSGRSRGFDFVTMSTVEEVEAATRQFNGYVSKQVPKSHFH